MFYEKGSPTRIGFLLMNSLKPFFFLLQLIVIMQSQYKEIVLTFSPKSDQNEITPWNINAL